LSEHISAPEENGRPPGTRQTALSKFQRLLTLTGVADRLTLTDVPEELLDGS